MSKPYSGIPLSGRRTWVVPRRLKEFFAAFAVVCVLVVVSTKLAQHFGGALERAKSASEADDLDGRLAPAVQLPGRGGARFDLASLRGKVVLLNFWATWCPPCRDEMPSLERLAGRFDRGGFEVVAVSVDESWAPVEGFVSPSSPLRVVLDSGANVARGYGTSKFPESYLIDREGRLRLKFVGPRDWDSGDVAVLLASWGVKPRS